MTWQNQPPPDAREMTWKDGDICDPGNANLAGSTFVICEFSNFVENGNQMEIRMQRDIQPP
ncbi:hypothetical protein TH47_16210 [Thalassospira sp. MCCC 1A02803]|nr:hypothetical protein AUQ41_13540 [Thalassospira sp. MCCC 1A02898]ONH86849.1 hypothetical protein TH47_16210 [Thalassospira sp. MCCC 1A02803]